MILNGHKTSVSLEEQFRTALKEIAQKQRMSASQLAARIDGSARAPQSVVGNSFLCLGLLPVTLPSDMIRSAA